MNTDIFLLQEKRTEYIYSEAKQVKMKNNIPQPYGQCSQYVDLHHLLDCLIQPMNLNITVTYP